MKNTGKCPKCGGGDIAFVPSDPSFQGDPYIRSGDGRIGMGINGVRVHRYVCCGCGYVEQWADPEELKRRPDARQYWDAAAQEYQEELERRDYFNRKAAEQREKEAQAKRLREKEQKRKDDPWN